MSGEATNPCLFGVGRSGSGTTLLQRTLDNHPDLAMENDTHFIPHTIKGIAADSLPELGHERSMETHSPEVEKIAVRSRDWRENAPSRRRGSHAAGKGSA